MVHSNKITTFAFLFLIVGIFTTQNIIAQQTHIVDLAGTGDFTSIHDAVTAAADGDTIRVQPDQYAFTAGLGQITIDKKLVIIGSGYMSVEEGGTELVDIAGEGYFSLSSSADGTKISGFRVQGAGNFLNTESGSSDIVIQENLFIDGDDVIILDGSQDTLRSNIFLGTGRKAVRLNGTNTVVHNNIFSGQNGGSDYVVYITNGTGVSIAYNLFMNLESISRVFYNIGSPEIFSNGFVDYNPNIAMIWLQSGSPFITNNAFYNNGGRTFGDAGLNSVEAAPSFVDFDADNDELNLETIDENSFDLNLADGSAWIDAGRTGTLYLDTDGSRSDIGIYAGPQPFEDGKGAPSIPVVIDFQVSPTTVSPSGTITIQATGRIGSGSN
jgi:hypothetical protein